MSVSRQNDRADWFARGSAALAPAHEFTPERVDARDRVQWITAQESAETITEVVVISGSLFRRRNESRQHEVAEVVG